MKKTNVLKRIFLILAIFIVATAGLTPVGSVFAAEDSFSLEEITVNELMTGYEEGDYTTEEVVQAYLERIAIYENTYNAFTFMNEDALEEAQEVDRLRAEGAELGPLAGVPIVIKEAVDVAGYPTTFGWAPLSKEAGGIELMPTMDAPIVTRLKEAGAIILGKTNIPAFSASGTHANTSWAGPTYNAVNPTLAPGGSSSGTAMSVSGNFAMLGIAEETGGSIQNPAAAQALVGIKPSFGLVPTIGVTPLSASTRDVLGPHARTVEDAALMLDSIAGYWETDVNTEAAIGNVPEDGYTAFLDEESLEGKRLGLYGLSWNTEELSEETQELYARAIEELESQGAEVVTDPFAGSGFIEYADNAPSSGRESFFYDLEKYLENLDPSDDTLSIESVFEKAGEVPWVEGGPLSSRANLPGKDNPDELPDLTAFKEVRSEYQRIIYEVMEKHDLDGFVYPQAEAAAPPLEEGRISATTVSEINISGLPLVTVPAGYYENGSPFALAFFGEMWSEAKLIGMAYDYEQATNHRTAPKLIQTVADFADLTPNNSHFPAIMDLVGAEAINGYPLEDGTREFRSDQTISRSQAAQMFMKALELTVPTDVDGVLENFDDVTPSNYYAEAIASTYHAGIFKGSAGSFMDGAALTREQMATVLVSALDLEASGDSSVDINTDNVDASHKASVTILAELGITNQFDDFRPKEAVTRGQFATFLSAAMEIE
ncbi:amidase family protein [Aquibacillus albus]|uniref:Asp-tRNA(Asn)/Glu-tRNA(Gln) amidotransferase A subunit family amidase n=1 Tax=Aquibacillus albus TaxID=1168171 RepID=A0ABS2MW38_9BACI|nr:amidase family protein [Aquibacillus albus]MBM7569993.1 Asp-tRNA(Asn)/Glu-tRNA(Gln) amidotransferase A subunit family amidase [Aquibacillus albus]